MSQVAILVAMTSPDVRDPAVITRDRSEAMARTRRAILDAAIDVLRTDQRASVTAIAKAAGTSRSTFHRYFAERAELITALQELAEVRLSAATASANIWSGSPRDGVLRLSRSYYELEDVMLVAYGDHTQNDDLEAFDDMDPQFLSLVAHGQSDGSISRDFTPEWLHTMLWQCIYAGWTMNATQKSTRAEAIELCMRTLDRLITPVENSAL